jgi:hypothetical protein
MAKQSALGSRPKQSFEKKLVGIADVKVGESKVKFTLTEDGKEFENGTNVFKCNIDDLPEVPNVRQFDGKQIRIRMKSEGDEVEALTPVSGLFTGVLVDLGPRPNGKDSDPTPYEKTFEKGEQKTSHLEFFAVYKITKGIFKGVQLPAYYLHYKFEEDEDGNTRYAGNFDNKKATRLFQLKEWMELHQLEAEPIGWDDVTILPELLERAEASDVEVQVIIKNGYISSLLPSEDEPDFMKDPEPVEEPKAKRPAKEINKEMGIDDEDEPKKPARKTKKIVEEDDDSDL